MAETACCKTICLCAIPQTRIPSKLGLHCRGIFHKFPWVDSEKGIIMACSGCRTYFSAANTDVAVALPLTGNTVLIRVPLADKGIRVTPHELVIALVIICVV